MDRRRTPRHPGAHGSLCRLSIVLAILGSLSVGPQAADALPAASAPDEAAPPAAATPPSEHARGKDEERPYWRTNIFSRIFTDQKYLVTNWWPREFKRPAFAAPLAATTLAAMLAHGTEEEGFGDSMSGTSADDPNGGFGTGLAGAFTRLGNGPAVAALLGVTYLGARWGHNDRLAEASSLSAESVIDAGIWIEVLKRSFARMRPSETNEGVFFQYGQAHSNSFPSGHAMGAFAVATVFAEKYRDRRWMPWVAYGTATLIGTSRIALGRHYPSDVLVGALLGNSIGRGVVERSRGDDLDRKQSWARRLTPLVDPARRGYGVAYSFDW